MYIFPPCPDEPKDLVARLLVVDPSQRITLDEVLKHPFFRAQVVSSGGDKKFSGYKKFMKKKFSGDKKNSQKKVFPFQG